MLQRLVEFLFEIGTLRKIPRAHRQSLLTDDLTDNIATHSFRVAHIGYTLAKLAEADSATVVLMCLFHDIEETRAGDQNRINKRYVQVDHEQIMHDQLAGLHSDDEILEIMEEYEAKETIEAQVAKDADILDQYFLLKEHTQAGNQEAKKRLEQNPDGKKERLHTQAAKALFDEMLSMPPDRWRQDIWTSQRK